MKGEDCSLRINSVRKDAYNLYWDPMNKREAWIVLRKSRKKLKNQETM